VGGRENKGQAHRSDIGDSLVGGGGEIILDNFSNPFLSAHGLSHTSLLCFNLLS